MSATSDVVVKNSAPVWREYLQLTKPRITLFCLLMTLGGAVLAPEKITFLKLLLTLLGTSFSVGSANALNMYWERNTDKLMKRTSARPLPAGRLNPTAALVFGASLGLASVFILGFGVNGITAALSLFALLSYVCIYTPLKRKTPHALLIGAVPGAMPPLLGWTAVSGAITSPGLVLFAILLIWQIPHFIAISVNHTDDYKKAGIKTWPGERGLPTATMQAFLYSLFLLPVSLLLLKLNVASHVYGATALVLGLWMIVLSARGFRPEKHARWAKQLFIASLVYLPVLTAGLAIDLLFIK